ncbi:MAG: aconitate hydratase, partial [Candidatus Scatosoma sp.]
PTGGGLGMLAFGAGGLDVAVAMGGGAYYIAMPKMIKVNLTGRLNPFVSAKDISLEILRILSVKGGVGAVIEWGGEGIASLSVPERATITNMGTELGATTSIFPSDEVTREFLKSQGREGDFTPLCSDPDAVYDRVIEIDLNTLEPLIACPHSPDNVKKVSEIAGMKIDQVCIGSCTNSSLFDLKKTAAMLRGKKIAKNVSLSVSPGSKQVLSMLVKSGELSDILQSGARLLECACGPCIGMGFSPSSAGVSLRTFNRNFLGRSGTKDGQVYLVSPETAAASAICGVLTDPRDFGEKFGKISVCMPEKFDIDDGSVLPPLSEDEAKNAEIVRGPNIKPFPGTQPMPERFICGVALKTGDDITTDHIMPAGAKILPYRSNIPYLSKFCFSVLDEAFSERAKEITGKTGGCAIVGGVNYGQGSSREHAALVPLYLGVKAVIAKSFARIHAANLVNAGILPLTFERPDDYEKIAQGAEIEFSDVSAGLEKGEVKAKIISTDEEIALKAEFTKRQRDILAAGGLLAYTKSGGK